MATDEGTLLNHNLCPYCNSETSQDMKCAVFSNKHYSTSCHGSKICPTSCFGNKKREIICQSRKGIEFFRTFIVIEEHN